MLIERPDRKAAGVSGCLQHKRRHCADQHCLGHTLCAVAADVAGDLTAPGGMTDMDHVFRSSSSTSVARSSA